MARLRDSVRDDPIGAAIIITVAALFALVLAWQLSLDQWQPKWPWDVPRMVSAPKPRLPAPPKEWIRDTAERDVLRVPDYPVVYWANPHAGYSKTAAARKPIAIVTHYTGDKPVLNLVRYGQSVDSERGGSFGYHVYIGRDGTAVQGAPLSKRTNHIKPPGHKMRKPFMPDLSNENTIGIALVGGCKVEDTPLKPITLRCIGDEATPEAQTAAMAIIEALRERYDIPCEKVVGHGELQHDRSSFEGVTIARLARASCRQEVAAVR